MDGPRLSLGDLIRAVGRLGSDESARDRLLEFCGYELAEKSTPHTNSVNPTGPISGESPDPKKLVDSNPNLDRKSENRIPAQAKVIESTDSPLRPTWMGTPSPVPRQSSGKRIIPSKPPLLQPQWTRGILTAALGTIGESNEVDIARLIDKMSRSEFIDRLPYQKVKSISRGAVVWIDRSASMEPFFQDQAQIVDALSRTIGEARLEVRECQGVPYEALESPPCIPHLVLSDLGLRKVEGARRTSTPAGWASLGVRVREVLGADMVVLTPSSAHRYSSESRAALTIITWDRATSVRSVSRARLAT